MSIPTAAQIDALLNFLEEHRELARGSLRSVEGRMLSHRLWEDICTTLNSMGGCTKTKKQWQKVWTDKKYFAKKAAVAARNSASATGGGPSTAPSLSQWELKVISIMGDGFGGPQTTARVPAFIEVTQEEMPASSLAQDIQSGDHIILELETQQQIDPNQSTSQQQEQQQADLLVSDSPTNHHQIRSSQQRRQRRNRVTDSSVRARLFQLEERRLKCEEQRNVELAGIRTAILEMCRLMQQLIEEVQARSH